MNFTVTILTFTTGLFSILGIDVNTLKECLFVSYLRSTYVSLYLEFTKETVNDDLKVKLTHTRDDCLSCFFVCMNAECRIFLSKFNKCFAHLVLTSFCFRLDSDIDNRLREFHGLKDYREALVTDCITSCCHLETNCCCDVTRVNFVKFLTFVSMHLKDTANTLFFALCSIQYVGTGVQSTGIYTEVSKLTYERVCHDLECKSCERLFIGRFTCDFLTIHVNALDSRNVYRRRHELEDSIQKFLNAFISVGCTAAYRDSLAFAYSLTKNCF